MKPPQATFARSSQADSPHAAVFFVLLSLASEAKHGYAVMQEVEQLSDGEVRMDLRPCIQPFSG